MAEIRKINFEEIVSKCSEKNKNYIPSNWYISARKAWAVFVWAMVQIECESKIRSSDDVNKFIHKFWEYIEEHAFAYGEENEDGTEKS